MDSTHIHQAFLYPTVFLTDPGSTPLSSQALSNSHSNHHSFSSAFPDGTPRSGPAFSQPYHRHDRQQHYVHSPLSTQGASVGSFNQQPFVGDEPVSLPSSLSLPGIGQPASQTAPQALLPQTLQANGQGLLYPNLGQLNSSLYPASNQIIPLPPRPVTGIENIQPLPPTVPAFIPSSSVLATIATHSRSTSGSSVGSIGLRIPSDNTVMATGSSPTREHEAEVVAVTYIDANRSFSTLDDAKAYVLDHARASGFGVSCRRSRKNRHGTIISAQMMCDRGRVATSTSTGQRRTRTRRTNCQWAVTISLNPVSGLWRLRDNQSRATDADDSSVVSSFETSRATMSPNGGGSLVGTVRRVSLGSGTIRLAHNHPLSATPESHPCHRKMTSDMEAFIEVLYDNNTRPSTIFQVLQQRFPDVLVNQQDVYNALARIKKRQSSVRQVENLNGDVPGLS